ncbi:TetR/AcrR family transcriptional regulator [Luteimonas saliphila]|uniref:TetR/AcrR family transcriptional regulator n=1 Tax=Luteimonas saliphila TaxID=2804919 RepID=UPI00192DCFF2|nr:TetR/AcrR family transcriptional regulator [Luteimonas saliphila]
MIYSSPAIHARRRRILDETRKLIAERGLSGFSMDEICRRADVAKRTLYNAFQTKERMIAIAIHEYFDRYVSKIPYSAPSGSLQGTTERLVFVLQRNRQIRNYITAIMSVYFSPDADPAIWETMHSMAVKSNQEWIQSLKGKRQLQPWIDPDQLADDVVRIEYAIIFDWCRGHISDDEIVLHLLTGHLTCMAGATRGAARRQIEEKLLEFHTSGIPAPVALEPAAKAAGAARSIKPAQAAKTAARRHTAKRATGKD